MASLPRALTPFRHRPYRFLAASLTFSLASDGLWLVAIVWQIVALHGGPSQLSLVATAAALGTVVTALLGGVLADRVPQRRILVAVEVMRFAAIGSVAALAISGSLQVWQLALASLVGGCCTGLYYPAYSALLPSIVPAGDLLAANGFEGMLRPTIMQAAGPAAASALIAASSPGAALAAAAVASAGAAVCVVVLPETPVRRDLAAASSHPVRAVFADLREGFAYMIRTPWLLWTLLSASLLVLVMIGPFEVLTPFAIKDHAGGGPAQHAWVLGAFGIGGALGSLLIGSLRLPRRYLTVMNLMWGAGCLPLVVYGSTTHVAVMVVAGFAMGAMFNGAMVIWGTLLQRRVPHDLLGRVSSLDFFVSLAFMPVSMAIAGPVASSLGLATTFALAGGLPLLIVAVALVAARMPRDEIEHPLDTDQAAETDRSEPATDASTRV